MSVSEMIALVSGIVAAVSAVCAIIAFFVARGKDHYKEGADDGGLRGDIKYMRNSFDELRLDVKEVARKQDAQAERIARVEESVKSAHHRIADLNDRMENIEKK